MATVKGTTSNDTLKGTAYADIIYGYAGNDVITGGAGADSMIGGTGNDTYNVDNTNDITTENSSEGTDTVVSSISYILGNNIENLILSGITNLNGTGNSLNNNLRGNSGNNKLNAGAGTDTLNGGLGLDTLIGGIGNDTYYIDDQFDVIQEYASEGTDIVYSLAGSYTLASNLEKLYLLNDGTKCLSKVSTTSDSTKVLTYGDQDVWKNLLDYYQGDNKQGYLACCGIVSSENVLIQAGVLATRSGYVPSDNVIDVQETKIIQYAIDNKFCQTTGTAEEKGITFIEQQEKIIEGYGKVNVSFGCYTLEEVAEQVKNNKCVLFNVNADKLWYGDNSGTTTNHVVLITGVAYNINNQNQIVGFYFCDSGYGEAKEYVSYDKVKGCSYYYDRNGNDGNSCCYALFTDSSIKLQVGTQNGIGNSLNNTITGSKYNNVIDAKDGNDTIIGGVGKDTLYGGASNDTYQFYLGDGTDLISDTSGTDKITFLSSTITKSNVAFFYSGNNLAVAYGTSDYITIQNQKLAGNAIESIYLSDGKYLSSADINKVIQSMTSYASSHSIQFTSISDVKSNTSLMNIIANSWHS